MAGTFNFCPNATVAETVPPAAGAGINFNGWNFTAKPNVPYQRTFKLALFGLKWYLTSAGVYDTTTDPTFNAALLEQFYQANQTWDTFSWVHPHGLGTLTCRFAAPLAIVSAPGGRIPKTEVMLVHHNPPY